MEKFTPPNSDLNIKKEKLRAKLLKKSSWWKNKLSKGQCYYCGKKVSPKELTMDHVIPLIRGGKSNKGNIVPCCKDCNNRKKYLLPFEWEEYLNLLNSSDSERCL